MASQGQGSEFFQRFDLTAARQHTVARHPAPHQAEALDELRRWYQSPSPQSGGGILVLPTGGGKTFTAVHFLSRYPLSDGYKVLWLAHTHHLLEQALSSFEPLVGLIAEPRATLDIRVVSGTIGHFPIHSIKPTDDVVVTSLQSARNAVRDNHPRFLDFVAAAGDKLMVVFDEAHHAPAPSYRNLMGSLRERCPGMRLLGLTATPTHSDESKRGWFRQLFPRGIIYQAEPKSLMAAGVLSRPVFEEANTSFEPRFEQREYETWVDTHRDLPEAIVTTLAATRERNDYIVGYYLANREKYGKTIIFADRWFQCDYLREALRSRGVRADVVYSHVDADPGSVEARNRRTADENAQVLRQFRENQLDVLINVRMLTEGTDVPDVQTVFLTRQTTSQILLTQMVGRALRGREFGGTEWAYIVSFIDNWKQRINWASYDQFGLGPVDEDAPDSRKRPPLQLISIELVRRLARQMDSGVNVNPGPFQKTFLPVGWYRVEYYAQVAGTEDVEQTVQLVMVFEDEKSGFERFIAALAAANLDAFQDDGVRLDDVRSPLSAWQHQFFGDAERVGGALIDDLFAVARHMAQNDRRPPVFFPFEDRAKHDLDAIAQEHLAADIGPRQANESLRAEYSRLDRLWRVIYYRYELFKSSYDACVNRMLGVPTSTSTSGPPTQVVMVDPPLPGEPTEEVKNQVKLRDGYRCLCCGNTARRQLQVDHILPRYFGGMNQLDNLQTLCRICNRAKGKEAISFRVNHTPLSQPPTVLPEVEAPGGDNAKDPEQWAMFVFHTINLFYRCAAVQSVTIGKRGDKFRTWKVELFHGNDERWLEPLLPDLVQRIRQIREEAGVEPAPDRIVVSA